jgi:cytochrome c
MASVFRPLLFTTWMMLLWAAPAMAEHATPGQAQALLDRAVATVQKDGPDRAFAQFDDPSAGFVVGDLYVFVFDLKGVYHASGANPRLVGSDAYDLTDVEGKPLVREMIARAKSSGHGEVSYVWLDRTDNKVERKHSLVQRVGDYIVGVGYYRS